MCRNRPDEERVRLPRPVRHERGEGRGEGCLSVGSRLTLGSASSPQPSPPFGTEERETEAPVRTARTFAKTDRTSCLRDRTGSIWHRTDCLGHRTSSIRDRISSLRHRISSIRDRTSSMRNRPGSISHTTDCLQQGPRCLRQGTIPLGLGSTRAPRAVVGPPDHLVLSPFRPDLNLRTPAHHRLGHGRPNR